MKIIMADAYPRLHTWAFLEAAEELINPRRDLWKPDQRMATVFLRKVDMLLGKCNDSDVNDPVIAGDLGGDEVLTGFRRAIRQVVALLVQERDAEALEVLKPLKEVFLVNAMRKYVDALLGVKPVGAGVAL